MQTPLHTQVPNNSEYSGGTNTAITESGGGIGPINKDLKAEFSQVKDNTKKNTLSTATAPQKPNLNNNPNNSKVFQPARAETYSSKQKDQRQFTEVDYFSVGALQEAPVKEVANLKFMPHADGLEFNYNNKVNFGDFNINTLATSKDGKLPPSFSPLDSIEGNVPELFGNLDTSNSGFNRQQQYTD